MNSWEGKRRYMCRKGLRARLHIGVTQSGWVMCIWAVFIGQMALTVQVLSVKVSRTAYGSVYQE